MILIKFRISLRHKANDRLIERVTIFPHYENSFNAHARIQNGDQLFGIGHHFKILRAILQESEAKLEMKNFNPLQFLCGGRLP